MYRRTSARTSALKWTYAERETKTVPDFACSSTRDVFSEYQSRELVNDVTDGFKLDECDGSDYTRDWSFPNCSLFPSGMDKEQYHCMFGTLYARTVMQALSGRKTFGQ